jgi:hypothetical protein
VPLAVSWWMDIADSTTKQELYTLTLVHSSALTQERTSTITKMDRLGNLDQAKESEP